MYDYTYHNSYYCSHEVAKMNIAYNLYGAVLLENPKNKRGTAPWNDKNHLTTGAVISNQLRPFPYPITGGGVKLTTTRANLNQARRLGLNGEA